jgi:hypothetical protein
MDLGGEEIIRASRETVWSAMNDTSVLAQCIPGCTELVKVSDNEMAAKSILKIGPIKASFTGKVTLTDISRLNGYTITGEGQGGAAGFAKGNAKVSLSDHPDGTLLAYEAKADVGGKLAQLGGRLIDATAKKLAGEFFAKFAAVVAGNSVA